MATGTDVEAVRTLVHTYAERIDAGDLDGLAALFEHATWRPAGEDFVARGAREVRRMYEPVILYDGSPRTKHLTSNVTVEVDGELARARSYYTVMQSAPGFPLQAIVSGRYEDTFECVEGTWRFTDRLITVDLIGDMSHHMRAGAYRLDAD